MLRLGNVATPLTAFTGAPPESVPLPGFAPSPSVIAPVNPWTTCSAASSAATCTGGAIAAPAWVVCGGCWVNPRWVGGGGGGGVVCRDLDGRPYRAALRCVGRLDGEREHGGGRRHDAERPARVGVQLRGRGGEFVADAGLLEPDVDERRDPVHGVGDRIASQRVTGRVRAERQDDQGVAQRDVAR